MRENTIPKRAKEGAPYPLTYEQLRIWLQYKINPLLPLYNVSAAFRIYGNLQIPALKRAIEMLIERHPILRTIYFEKDQAPYQRVLRNWQFELELINLRPFDAEQKQQRLAQLLQQFSQSAINLEQELPLRAMLIQLDEHDFVLQFLIHHIASDGWSQNVLYEDLSSIYNQIVLRSGESLVHLPIQYVDYAIWQADSLKREGYGEELNFWKNHLSNPPVELNLPTDSPVSPNPDYLGAVFMLTLPEHLSAALRKWSANHKATLFVTMLCAMYIWLWRYSGQTDLVVGVPLGGRPFPELHHLLGCFINTLALRQIVNPKSAFLDFFEEVRRDTFTALSYQRLPLELILSELRAKRGRDGHVLFHTLLNFLSYPDTMPAFHGCQVERLHVYKGFSMYDLALLVKANKPQIELGLEYQCSLFTRETVERMAKHYVHLLEAIVEDDSRPLGRLPMLSADEQEQIIKTWNATQREYPFAGGVHRLIEAQVARSPQHIAVSFAGQSLTYAQLNAEANRLARYLLSQGLRREAVVALYLPRSLTLVTAMLAVLKAGGAFLFLDPTYPDERVRFMIQNSGCNMVLTAGGIEPPTNQPGVMTVDLVNITPHLEAYRPEDLPNPVHGENRAYLIYTSGSTGKPKGVMVPHRALENHMRWMQEAYPLGEEDKVFQKTPLSFDACVWEFFAPLMVGGELVLAKPDGHRDIPYLLETIQQERITILQVVPTLLHLLLEREGFKQCTSLRRVFCGGEALDAALVRRFYEAMQAELVNLYGLSETCIDTTTWTCHPDEKRVPIGRPIFNVQNYVLDDEFMPCPIGVVGELYISGAALGRGYIHQPARTAESFLPNPFSSHGERIYRTGDLARYLSDGAIEFVGRKDFQIKLRGYRIELDEIQALLRAHPKVDNAVVVVEGEKSPEARLIAYIIPRENAPLQAEEIIAYLRQSLPEYMLPSRVMFLGEFPLTESGKVDRQALRSYEHQGWEEDTTSKPRDAVERALAVMWGQVLGMRHIGREQSFFDLGGHSLLAIKLAALLEEVFQVNIPIGMIFEYPRIAEMAKALRTIGEPSKNIVELAELFLAITTLSEEEVEDRLRQASPEDEQ